MHSFVNLESYVSQQQQQQDQQRILQYHLEQQKQQHQQQYQHQEQQNHYINYFNHNHVNNINRQPTAFQLYKSMKSPSLTSKSQSPSSSSSLSVIASSSSTRLYDANNIPSFASTSQQQISSPSSRPSSPPHMYKKSRKNFSLSTTTLPLQHLNEALLSSTLIKKESIDTFDLYQNHHHQQQQPQQQQQQHQYPQSLSSLSLASSSTSPPLVKPQTVLSPLILNNNCDVNKYNNSNSQYKNLPSSLRSYFSENNTSSSDEANKRLQSPLVQNITDNTTGNLANKNVLNGIVSAYAHDDSKCHVCGDKSTGSHFGGISCESCKAFFRRSVQNDRNMDYKCTYQNSCEMNINTRKICQSCRYRTCLAIGMRPKWVLSDSERLQKYGSRRRKGSSASISNGVNLMQQQSIMTQTTITSKASLTSISSISSAFAGISNPSPSNSNNYNSPLDSSSSSLITNIATSTLNSNSKKVGKYNNDNDEMTIDDDDCSVDYEKTYTQESQQVTSPQTPYSQNSIHHNSSSNSLSSNLSPSVSHHSGSSSETNSPYNANNYLYSYDLLTSQAPTLSTNNKEQDQEIKAQLEEEFYRNGVDSIDTINLKLANYDCIIIDKLAYAFYHSRKSHSIDLGSFKSKLGDLMKLSPVELNKISKIILANFIQQPIKRVITFAKLLPDFRRLNVCDQISLLRDGAMEIFICSAQGLFDKRTNSVQNIISRDRHIDADAKQQQQQASATTTDGKSTSEPTTTTTQQQQKPAGLQLDLLKFLWSKEVFEETIKYLRSMVELEIDEATLILYIPLILFSPDRRELKNRTRVLELQTRYSLLLYKYLIFSQKSIDNANRLYSILLLKLVDLRNLHELHSSILIEADEAQLEVFSQAIIKNDKDEKIKCKLNSNSTTSCLNTSTIASASTPMSMSDTQSLKTPLSNDDYRQPQSFKNDDANNTNDNSNFNELSPTFSVFSTPSTSQTDYE